MSTIGDNNDQYVGGSGEETSNKKECTSCEQNNIDTITEGIDSIAVLDMSTCAACGKEGKDSDMNTCNRCEMVKYCNAACKKKHRTKHKKKCDRRVAELFDEQLFKDVDEPDECQICFLPLPCDESKNNMFQSCCGKIICNGCMYAIEVTEETKDLCAFCRKPPPTSEEEIVVRLKNLMETGHAKGTHLIADCYASGDLGYPQDWNKANELLLKAGELGCAEAYLSLGYSYHHGRGVEVDQKKFDHYIGLAAIKGNVRARVLLAATEGLAGNEQRANKHWMIAAKAGRKESLDMVKKGFMNGFVSKEEYASTLHTYHQRQKETKSDERDRAKAYYEARAQLLGFEGRYGY